MKHVLLLQMAEVDKRCSGINMNDNLTAYFVATYLQHKCGGTLSNNVLKSPQQLSCFDIGSLSEVSVSTENLELAVSAGSLQCLKINLFYTFFSKHIPENGEYI